MITINNLSLTVGMFITMAFGSVLSWRHVAFVCALFPMSCVVAVTFVPETPSWLLSKGRIDKAQQSLQWLRGWVTPQTVQREFDELCQFSDTSNACNLCATQKIKCNHPPPTVIDKIKQLKQRRNIKPFVLVVLLEFFGTFNGSYIWDPYIIQVLNAYGTPIKSNYATILTSGIGVVGSIFLLATIKKLGRRRMFLITSFILAICCFGLSLYITFIMMFTIHIQTYFKVISLQVLMVSPSLDLIGLHSKKIQMNRPKIPMPFVRLSAISVTWRLHSF